MKISEINKSNIQLWKISCTYGSKWTVMLHMHDSPDCKNMLRIFPTSSYF